MKGLNGMNKAGMAAGAAVFASMGLAGCQSLASAAGVTKVTPDEFRVVTKAPLVVPPEYALRPPAPGETRPVELAAATGGANLLFGQDVGGEATPGEQYLVARAGATASDPQIRAVLDYEEAGIVRKNRNFVQMIIDYGTTSSASPLAGTPVDADEEARRLAAERAVQSATGGGDVTIEKGGSRLKLPGT